MPFAGLKIELVLFFLRFVVSFVSIQKNVKYVYKYACMSWQYSPSSAACLYAEGTIKEHLPLLANLSIANAANVPVNANNKTILDKTLKFGRLPAAIPKGKTISDLVVLV